MTKPTLLLFFGHGWAAGSPLGYTLQRLTRYCHLGWVKNINYLKSLDNDICVNQLFTKIRAGRITSLDQWCDYESNRGHRFNYASDLEPLKDFPEDMLWDMVYKPITLERYITYYNTIWDCVKDYGYKAVADFEELYPGDRKLPGVLEELSKHFILKSITVVRDPIRRAFGQYGASFKDVTYNPGYQPDVIDYLRRWDMQKELIPDSHLCIMELLWDQGPRGDRERQKLSRFLDTPVTDMWPNLYVPDQGHYLNWDRDTATTYCPTPCQALGQAEYELTPETYKEYKKKYQHLYDQWQRRFGILPSNWGMPIDYKKNKGHDFNATMPYLKEKYNLDLGRHYNL